MKKKAKKPAKTRVICAYTNCIHNKVDGMEYVCTLDKIYTSFHSMYGHIDWKMQCDMQEES